MLKSDSKFHLDCGDAVIHGEIVGDGSSILLIHGWPLDRRVFSPQIAQLSQHFTVISYDRRGFGESSGEPDLRRELDDINRLLDSYTDQTVHLLGMSQGARVALRYCVKHNDRLRSLILQGAVIDGVTIPESVEEKIPVSDYAELVQQGRIKDFISLWLQHPLMHVDNEHKDAIALINIILAEYKGRDLLNFSPESYSYPVDMMSILKRIALPTLLLTGSNETSSRKKHAEELRGVLDNAREIVLANSGHLSNLTEQELYNQSVIDFCAEVDSK